MEQLSYNFATYYQLFIRGHSRPKQHETTNMLLNCELEETMASKYRRGIKGLSDGLSDAIRGMEESKIESNIKYLQISNPSTILKRFKSILETQILDIDEVWKSKLLNTAYDMEEKYKNNNDDLPIEKLLAKALKIAVLCPKDRLTLCDEDRDFIEKFRNNPKDTVNKWDKHHKEMVRKDDNYTEEETYSAAQYVRLKLLCDIFIANEDENVLKALSDIFMEIDQEISLGLSDIDDGYCAALELLYRIYPIKVSKFIILPALSKLFDKCDKSDNDPYLTFLYNVYYQVDIVVGKIKDKIQAQLPDPTIYRFIQTIADFNFSRCKLDDSIMAKYPEFISTEYYDDSGEIEEREPATSNNKSKLAEPCGAVYKIDIQELRSEPEHYEELIAALNDKTYFFKNEYEQVRAYYEELKSKYEIK